MSGNRSGRHSLRRYSQGARVTVSSAVTRSGRAGGGPRTQRPEDTRGRLAGGTEARCYTRSPGTAPSRPRAPPRSRSRRVPRVRALLSVANRDGIGPFARDLLELGVEVFATDGTREVLASDGIEVGPISALTAVPPLLGGQVKTFHPAVYAGILARRDRPDQLAELAEQGIGQIDVVVVNVKPFAPQVGARVVPLHEAIEMIDVGGVALLSAAARNYAGVAAVPDPAYYTQVLAELRTRGQVSAELRQRLPPQALPPAAAHDRLREEVGPALRREPASAGRLLPGDDAPLGLPRRCDPVPGLDADLQRPPRSRRRLPHRERLHVPHRGHRQARQPGGHRLERRARGRLPPSARDRLRERLRGDGRHQPGPRRPNGSADRRERL